MDRLSSLPDSIILSHLFWFLPTRDAVRMSALSNRWKDLWTTIHFLNFENHTTPTTIPFLNFENFTMPFDDQTDHRFKDFVNRALIRWNGERLEKFKVESCFELERSIRTDIDLWLHFALNRKVEELYLHTMIEGVYMVPQFVYSSSSLKVLSIKHCKFRIDQNVQWDQLKRLTISQCLWLTEDVIEKILSGSPKLEALILSFVKGGANLSLRSQSLKELSIYKYLFEKRHLSKSSKLEIWAPKIEILRIEGTPYSKCLLLDVSSLTHATFGFPGQHDYEDKHESSSEADFVGDKISRILQTILLVENVTLSCCCIKVLGAIEKRSFPNVKVLKIGYCNGDFGQLLDLIEIFPQLKRLVLQHKEGDCYLGGKESVKFDAKSYLNLPSSFLLQLRTVDVTWEEGDNIFPFIKVLFKYASNLEKMVFRVKENQPSILNMASQKLLGMPRSSPGCTVDFLCDVTN